jgi:hypothetical protein
MKWVKKPFSLIIRRRFNFLLKSRGPVASVGQMKLTKEQKRWNRFSPIIFEKNIGIWNASCKQTLF